MNDTNDCAALTLREQLYLRGEIAENRPAFVITWLGHSCFKISFGSYSVVIDPYVDGMVPGMPPLRTSANEVLCSHEHDDHNCRSAVRLQPSPAARPFSVDRIETFHDDAQGKKRGNNTVHLLSAGSLRIAHFGDIGCALTSGQVSLLSGLDAAMIPVGGIYTIGPHEAREMAELIRPRVVIPMHYRGANFGFPVLETGERYASLVSDAVFYDIKTMAVTGDTPRQTAFLKYV